MAQAIQAYGKQFLIPESSDPCPIWIGYYKHLRKEVGTAHAKVLWLITWKSNGSVSCLSDPNFSNWLKRHNLNVSNIASKTIADLSEISGNFLGLGKQFSKVIAVGIPVLTVTILLGMIWIVKNSAKKLDLEDLAAITPVGRGVKLLK